MWQNMSDPWRRHCGLNLALTRQVMDTGPLRVSRGVWVLWVLWDVRWRPHGSDLFQHVRWMLSRIGFRAIWRSDRHLELSFTFCWLSSVWVSYMSSCVHITARTAVQCERTTSETKLFWMDCWIILKAEVWHWYETSTVDMKGSFQPEIDFWFLHQQGL